MSDWAKIRDSMEEAFIVPTTLTVGITTLHFVIQNAVAENRQ